MKPNGRIAVLCPTRGRPDSFARLCESVKNTSHLADVIGYVDEDEKDKYPTDVCVDEAGLVRGRTICGPRIGVSKSANAICEAFPDYSVYGLITDDSIVTTTAWDLELIEEIDRFPQTIGVVSPSIITFHAGEPNVTLGTIVDMPFVSHEWVQRCGFFAHPSTHHYAWPTIIQITALALEKRTGTNRLTYSTEDKFHIRHDDDKQYPPDEWMRMMFQDAFQVWWFCMHDLERLVEHLRV